MIRKIPCLFFLLSSLVTLPACTLLSGYPRHYSAEPIEAKVIDAQTQQSLEGVIVVANWELEGGTYGGNVVVGQLTVMEAVTDRNGRFVFPAWGPTRPRAGGLRNKDPQLLLFKPGYEYQRLLNTFRPGMYAEPVRRSEWHGKTIKLKVLHGELKEYVSRFESFNHDVERIVTSYPRQCDWKKIPNTVRSMNRERQNLIGRGINPHTLSSIDNELFLNDEYYAKKGGCGSPRAFVEGLRQ